MPDAPASNAELLVLTGPCGIGKTTLANAWADARGGAAIHADAIHLWIRVRSVRRARGYQEELKLQTSLAAARELLGQGLSVALDNVWLPGSLERFRAELCPLTTARMARLRCDLPINQSRDQGRPTGRMGPRVAELAAELEAMIWPAWLPILDTTALSAVQSLAAIDALPPVLPVTFAR